MVVVAGFFVSWSNSESTKSPERFSAPFCSAKWPAIRSNALGPGFFVAAAGVAAAGVELGSGGGASASLPLEAGASFGDGGCGLGFLNGTSAGAEPLPPRLLVTARGDEDGGRFEPTKDDPLAAFSLFPLLPLVLGVSPKLYVGLRDPPPSDSGAMDGFFLPAVSPSRGDAAAIRCGLPTGGRLGMRASLDS